MEGSCCPLAARGRSRDGTSAGKAQIEYGLTCDPEGRPVAVEVFAGNTADPTAFISAAATVKQRFELKDVVMVGDRGMITSARIEALKAVGGFGWLTSLRAPSIAALAASGALQVSFFDEANFAEITHPDYPASAWWPAGTPPWQQRGHESAPSCWLPPRPTWTMRTPPSTESAGRCGARTRSPCGWARS